MSKCQRIFLNDNLVPTDDLSFRFEIAPEVGVDGGVNVGLKLRFNIEGRKFKENEEVHHYTIQPHVKQFKVSYDSSKHF